MADEIIIDVQVNTSEVQQKLSTAIKDLADLKTKQKDPHLMHKMWKTQLKIQKKMKMESKII